MYKKVLLVALLAASLSACNGRYNKNKENENDGKSFTHVKEVPFKAPDYLSKDLAMQDLGGQVKTMVYSVCTCDEYGNIIKEDASDYTLYFAYDVNGTMTKGFAQDKDDKGVKLVRGKDGTIERVEYLFVAQNMTYSNVYQYNPNGTIDKEHVDGTLIDGETRNVYQDNVLKEAYATTSGEGVTEDVHTTFMVIEVDKHGNWTKRFCYSASQYTDEQAPGEVNRADNYAIESRVITYYK